MMSHKTLHTVVKQKHTSEDNVCVAATVACGYEKMKTHILKYIM